MFAVYYENKDIVNTLLGYPSSVLDAKNNAGK